MSILNLFVIFLFARLIDAYPSPKSQLLDSSENADLDQSWIATQDDSSPLNDISDQDYPSLPSTQDSATQPALYAENSAEDNGANAEPFYIPSEISDTWGTGNSCNSAKSLITMTDEVGASNQGAGSFCPSGLTSKPRNPKKKPVSDGKSDEEFPPPDCTRMAGNPRMAFCCELGPPNRNGRIEEIELLTIQRKCQKCKLVN